MVVDYAFICDYADQGSKLGALGIGFDTIYAQQVPCVHPSFHLVLQLRSSAAEAGTKDVRVSLIDADGKDVIPPLSVSMEIPQPPPGTVDAHGRLVAHFAGVKFAEYGQYALHVTLQGSEIVRIPIRVAQPPTTA